MREIKRKPIIDTVTVELSRSVCLWPGESSKEITQEDIEEQLTPFNKMLWELEMYISEEIVHMKRELGCSDNSPTIKRLTKMANSCQNWKVVGLTFNEEK